MCAAKLRTVLRGEPGTFSDHSSGGRFSMRYTVTRWLVRHAAINAWPFSVSWRNFVTYAWILYMCRRIERPLLPIRINIARDHQNALRNRLAAHIFWRLASGRIESRRCFPAHEKYPTLLPIYWIVRTERAFVDLAGRRLLFHR